MGFRAAKQNGFVPSNSGDSCVCALRFRMEVERERGRGLWGGADFKEQEIGVPKELPDLDDWVLSNRSGIVACGCGVSGAGADKMMN